MQCFVCGMSRDNVASLTRPVVSLRRVTALYTQALVRSHLACPWPYALRAGTRTVALRQPERPNKHWHSQSQKERKKKKTLHLCCFTITIVYFIT